MQIVDSPPPPTVWDAKKSVEDSRAEGEAQDLPHPIPDGTVGTSVSKNLSEEDLVILMTFSGCKDADFIQKCWDQCVNLPDTTVMQKLGRPVDLIKVRMEEQLSARLIAESREGTRRGKRP